MVVERTNQPKYWPPAGPSCQLLAQWIVKAWAKVPKELVQKLWEVCGYKSTEDLNNEEEKVSVAIVNYSQEQLGTMIENIAGDYERMAWIDEVNDRQTYLPRKTMMSVGMVELIKGLLCVGKYSNTEIDIILFGDITMHSNGSYFNQGSVQQYPKCENLLCNEF